MGSVAKTFRQPCTSSKAISLLLFLSSGYSFPRTLPVAFLPAVFPLSNLITPLLQIHLLRDDFPQTIPTAFFHEDILLKTGCRAAVLELWLQRRLDSFTCYSKQQGS